MSAAADSRTYRDLSELTEGCYSALKSLEMTGVRWGRPFRSYRPSLTKYGPYQWLWDSGWHMIAWSHRQPEKAIADLRTLLQFQRADGFIPEIIFWKPGGCLNKLADFYAGYSRPEFTDLSQMPMLAYSVRAIWQATRDKELLKEFVPKISRFLEWWHSRDHDGDGLISIIHPWESGLDASPIYDLVFHLSDARPFQMYRHFWRLLREYHRVGWNQELILRKEWFNFEDVGLCSVHADGWAVLAELAQQFDNELASRCRDHHLRLQEVIIRKCWNSQRGQFVSYFHQDAAEIASPVETIQTLFPLLLDGLPLQIQLRLVEKIKDPRRFWLPYPLPTVSKSERQFNPKESRLLSRGPMWPAPTWLVMEGLLKHGFDTEAGAILDRWSELYLRSGVWEYYDPLTGKGLGQKGLGMSTIIVDMLKRLGRI